MWHEMMRGHSYCPPTVACRLWCFTVKTITISIYIWNLSWAQEQADIWIFECDSGYKPTQISLIWSDCTTKKRITQGRYDALLYCFTYQPCQCVNLSKRLITQAAEWTNSYCYYPPTPHLLCTISHLGKHFHPALAHIIAPEHWEVSSDSP